MPQVPEPLMCGDQAASVVAPIWDCWPACHHHFEDGQQLLGHFEVALIAGVVESNEDLVGQPAGVARGLGIGAVVSLGVAHVSSSLPL
jgi:hypothetical protein